MVLAVILHSLEGTQTVFHSQFFGVRRSRAAEQLVASRVADAHAFAARARRCATLRNDWPHTAKLC